MENKNNLEIPKEFICPITLEIMKEPMIMPDGQSYEKEAIKKALSITHVSPLTKAPMKFSDGVINYSLKSLIENYVVKHKINLNTRKEIKINLPEEPKAEKIEFEELSAHVIPMGINPYNDSIHIYMKPKKTKTSPPICLFLVVDISGSMWENCCKNISSMEKSYISRLELVKHSIKTIISSLRKTDIISIITFSNNSKIVVPPTLLATKEIKDTVIKKINPIEPDGMTNMWSGIQMALKVSSEIKTCAFRKSIMIFTDGMSNSDPPLGIIPTLKQTLSTVKNDFTISTFSFGNEVDSALLTEIAKLGNGIYGFCPDASMVGTIFINYMANLLSTITGVVKVSVEQNREKSKIKTIGPLYRGAFRNTMFNINIKEVGSLKVKVELPLVNQTFDVQVIKDSSSINIDDYMEKMKEKNKNKENKKEDDEVLDEENEEEKVENIEDIDTNKLIEEAELEKVPYEEIILNQIYREKFITLLNKVINIKKTDIDQGLKEILDFNDTLKKLKYRTEFIKNLSDDIIHPDPNHGQVEKALKKEYYSTWGNRYLTSFFRFHFFEQCGNFKDLSLQLYGQNVFNAYRKMANTLFISLPPPKVVTEDYNSSFLSNSSGISLNMQNFVNPHGGCFNGEAITLLANGNKKLVKDLKKGDILVNGAVVQCLIEQAICKSKEKTLMCDLDGVLFSPYHPVLVNGKWIFPVDIKKVKSVHIESWFNLVLKDELNKKFEVEFENGIKAITLGHYRKENKVLEHPYFGTIEVIKDLKERDPIGYENGYIFIEEFNRSKIQLDENSFCVNYYKVK